jgi:hypothetical protein
MAIIPLRNAVRRAIGVTRIEKVSAAIRIKAMFAITHIPGRWITILTNGQLNAHQEHAP